MVFLILATLEVLLFGAIAFGGFLMIKRSEGLLRVVAYVVTGLASFLTLFILLLALFA